MAGDWRVSHERERSSEGGGGGGGRMIGKGGEGTRAHTDATGESFDRVTRRRSGVNPRALDTSARRDAPKIEQEARPASSFWLREKTDATSCVVAAAECSSRAERKRGGEARGKFE